jgi:hypothetical protein
MFHAIEGWPGASFFSFLKKCLRNRIMKKAALTSFFSFAAALVFGQMPNINSIAVLNSTVERYGKFEATLDLAATFTNPYDYDQIVVSATFTSPGGQTKTVDGFFMQDFVLNETTGNLTPAGPGGFRVRFSPNETGQWNYSMTVMDVNGTSTPVTGSFQCNAANTPANHGFIRTNPTNYLNFDDGNQYIAIGENIAWQNSNAYLNYKSWLGKLIQNGGNFFRLWHAHWGLGIEWKTGNGYEGLRRYHQRNSFYQDWMYDFCAENGVYIMLALQHHGPVSTQVNPNWNDSPYNVANGGPCQNTLEFFTNQEARDHTRNRYRYIVARWGYSRAILCWELFNEVHWTDGFQLQSTKDKVAAWHYQMAVYLKTIDPNSHLVTTSYGDDFTDPNVWSHEFIDFTQTHFYINTPNLERALANGNRAFLDEFEKPTLNGEFGLGGSASLANTDPDGIHIHNCLWGGLFSGGLGTAMTWWWDNYIHPKDLYYHFSGLSQVVEEVPFLDKKLAPAASYVTGAPGDLALTPSLGWSGIGTASITIGANGVLTPPDATLGQFLYGSQWNTQFRSPPTFSVSYPAAGKFSVKTASETGADPKIAIWLDGAQIINQAAAVNTTYSIDVPAGPHTIKVDNTGTDWITIASYTFEGLGSQVDAYVLVSQNKKTAAGWALNNRYNHEFVAENGEPDPSLPPAVVVDGFENGSYSVRWYNPLTGVLFGGAPATAAGGQLEIPLPAVYWDVAFVVDDSPVAVADLRKNLEFKVYPNPARVGQEVRLEFEIEKLEKWEISLLDMAGREVKRTVNSANLRLPEELPAGFYWVKMESGGRVGVMPVVVK